MATFGGKKPTMRRGGGGATGGGRRPVARGIMGGAPGGGRARNPKPKPIPPGLGGGMTPTAKPKARMPRRGAFRNY